MVVDSLLVATFVPSRILRLSFMPRLSKRLGKALEQLPRLTLNMLDQERKRSSSAHPGHARHNVMTTLVRLSDQAKEHDRLGASIEKSTVTTVRKQYLTEEEIAGNLFVLTAAGYDTTSNTMSYECDQEQDYAAIFPKLSRCLAVMVSSIPPSLSLIPSD
jgi:cytochrome P450